MQQSNRRHFMLTGAALLLAQGAAACGLDELESLAGVIDAGPAANANANANTNHATDAIVDAFLKTQPFYGVVMLAKRGKVVYTRTVGMANIEDSRPVRADTPFAIASISKWLSTATVLRLVDMGKLRLDAPILSFLPAFSPESGAKVTLRHLLSNSSGIPNLFATMVKADRALILRDMSTQEAVTTFCQGALIFPPGSKFDYALTNWIIVAAIVEAAAGQPFQAAMRTLTLDPLQLAATRADAAYADAPTSAIAYATVAPPVRRSDVRPAYLAAAGGYYSSADDLVRAAQAVYNGSFLTPASLAQMVHIEVASEAYALGGRVKTLQVGGQPQRFGWDTGRTTGFRSVLGHRLDGEDTVVVLNNTDLSQRVMDEFAISLLGATQTLL